MTSGGGEMKGKEYLAILKENDWKRSELVCLLEKQVGILEKNKLQAEAEETKWLIFDIAEIEKKLGYGLLKNRRNNK